MSCQVAIEAGRVSQARTASGCHQISPLSGRVAEFPLLAAHGDTLEEALREIETVIGYVIADLKESGGPIPKPSARPHFDGRFDIPIASDLHRALAVEAAREGVSLNQLVSRRLAGDKRIEV